ncbi:hypothetical protein F1880_008079 [Penicillium rolfsii]|nr:hypothetical protein F1880_008079 [Penicillium rolfsii]
MPSAIRPISIPTIDFGKFTLGSASEKAQCCELLRDSLSTHGFARIINSGISDEDIDRCFQFADEFFQMPPEAKQSVANMAGPTPQRGWSHLGAENSSSLYSSLVKTQVNKQRSDSREHWDQGHEEDQCFPNKWPSDSDITGFRPFMQSFYKSCERISFQLLEALELAMELPPATFQSRIHNASELRMNHYPPINVESLREGSISRIWPHFDLGVLTMLWTAGASGLEFQNRLDTDGKSFIPVVPVSQYEMILNISETLQRWTNDVLPAGLHQVTTPPNLKGANEGVIPERFSIAYFCKANRETSVGTLPPFVHPVKGAKYEDITALEYHQSRLRTAY